MANANPDVMKKICLLTGGSGRFGSAFCKLYSNEYNIVALFRRTPPQVATQDSYFIDPLAPSSHLVDNDGPVFAVKCDLMQDGEHDRVLDIVLARFGCVDLLINAAAICQWGSLVASTRVVTNALNQFQMNAIVPLKLSTTLLRRCWRDNPLLNQERNRNIINLSSKASTCLFPGRGQSVYSASKAALDVFTIHMADEFSKNGVRVNSVSPNSFPSVTSTDAVTRAVRELDQGRETGQIISID